MSKGTGFCCLAKGQESMSLEHHTLLRELTRMAQDQVSDVVIVLYGLYSGQEGVNALYLGLLVAEVAHAIDVAILNEYAAVFIIVNAFVYECKGGQVVLNPAYSLNCAIVIVCRVFMVVSTTTFRVSRYVAKTQAEAESLHHFA